MKRTRVLTVTAMLSGMAVILQYLGSWMQLKVGGFLDVEFSDLPAIIGTLALGPLCGVLVELMKNVLHCFISHTGFVGEFANVCINGLFVLVLGLVYKYNKTKKGALLGFGAATLLYTPIGAFINYFILLPLYVPAWGSAEKLSTVLTIITPFNLVKGAVLSVITLFVYKKLSPIIKRG